MPPSRLLLAAVYFSQSFARASASAPSALILSPNAGDMMQIMSGNAVVHFSPAAARGVGTTSPIPTTPAIQPRQPCPSIVKPPLLELAGGYRVGETVYCARPSRMLESGNRLEYGLKGEVVGAVPEIASGLAVKFEGNNGVIHCHPTQLRRNKPQMTVHTHWRYILRCLCSCRLRASPSAPHAALLAPPTLRLHSWPAATASARPSTARGPAGCLRVATASSMA